MNDEVVIKINELSKERGVRIVTDGWGKLLEVESLFNDLKDDGFDMDLFRLSVDYYKQVESDLVNITRRLENDLTKPSYSTQLNDFIDYYYEHLDCLRASIITVLKKGGVK